MLTLFLALLAPAPALAQSGVATLVAGATVYENQPDRNGGGYGEVCIGNLGAGTTRRGFVRFNLPAMPPGAIVTRVVYNLTQVRARFNCPTCPLDANIEIRRVLAAWQEGIGGANNAACGGGSNVPGVNWNSLPSVQGVTSATEFMPAGSGIPITIDTDIGTDDDGLLADVQAWVDNPASNYGWELRVLEEATNDNARLVNPGSATIYWTLLPPLNFSSGFEAPE